MASPRVEKQMPKNSIELGLRIRVVKVSKELGKVERSHRVDEQEFYQLLDKDGISDDIHLFNDKRGLNVVLVTSRRHTAQARRLV